MYVLKTDLQRGFVFCYKEIFILNDLFVNDKRMQQNTSSIQTARKHL